MHQKQWISHPVVLQGPTIELRPLEAEHLEELYEAAADPRLWAFTPTDGSRRATFLSAYRLALAQRMQGLQYPFVLYHRTSGRLIGSTRLFDIFPQDRKLEIGWTWIIPFYWGTGVNLEGKLLLLTYCFETLGAVRVQLKTKDDNLRSRRAIEKLGAKLDGILRKDRLQENGRFRNTAYYSLLDDEWPEAKKTIEQRLQTTRSEMRKGHG